MPSALWAWAEKRKSKREQMRWKRNSEQDENDEQLAKTNVGGVRVRLVVERECGGKSASGKRGTSEPSQ
ncbi:MAG: hypothetical protein Q4E16_02860 [Neisseria sp.]|nr:hypothetical protein [Neisseria sp.]